MAQLLPAQNAAVNALLQGYQNPDLEMQHHLFISGEMGTGKTYMGSAIIAQLKPKHVLIVCPRSMPTKWQNVSQDFTGIKSVMYQPKMTKDELIAANVLIVTQDKLFSLVKKLYETNDNFDKLQDHIQKSLRDEDIVLTPYEDKFEHYFDFVICDEIHTYKPTHQVFRALAMLCCSKIYLLGLTGTLFRQNIADLHCLLMVTNPEFENLDYQDDNLRDPAWFYTNIWRYISVPISLKDVERQQVEEVKQDIMPLKGITLSPEQQAWYELAKFNLKRLSVSNTKIDQITTNYLDLPQEKQPTISRSVADSYNSMSQTRIRSKYISGMTLTPIKLVNTPKFKQLQGILKKSPDKTIIFVQNTDFGKELALHLDHAFVIPKALAVKDVAEYVNDRLNGDYDLAIATIKQIQTGIDLNSAHQIIWYQVPNDVTAILQAQRRVLRLNSTNNSKVWFLFYNNTAQETIIKDVSRSATNNAAAYNVRRDDNLTRLTGLLLGELDDLEMDD